MCSVCMWILDLVQRLWTFTMSCVIGSAVLGVMAASSMSGLALGYHYSMAEFLVLKDTNVSIFLKRGVFDDAPFESEKEDWRRSGPSAGHIDDYNLITGAPDDDEATTLRSGRRLDDSLFEVDDINKYEGSLMKLTAKPVYQDTTYPKVTDDVELADAYTRFPPGSLNQMKAILSLVDSRRAMATGGTTLTPLATYPSIEIMLPYMPMNTNPNQPGNPDRNLRRMMAPGSGMEPPHINPARYAVPGPDIGSRDNWLIPKRPDLFNKDSMPDYYVLSPTYPSAITLNNGIVRPTNPTTKASTEKDYERSGSDYVTRTLFTMKSLVEKHLEKMSEALNEPFLLEDDEKRKFELPEVPNPEQSEEDYEEEIKGYPSRKRRNIKKIRRNNSTRRNVTHPGGNNSLDNIGSSSSAKNISLLIDKLDNDTKNYYTIIKDPRSVKVRKDSVTDIETLEIGSVNNQMNVNQFKSDLRHENAQEQNTNPSKNEEGETLLDRIVRAIETKKSTLTETTKSANLNSDKKIRMPRRRKSFESKIVSNKYVPNKRVTRSFGTKQMAISNAEILNSISVSLNEAGLLSNPASSTFVKLLQSSVT